MLVRIEPRQPFCKSIDYGQVIMNSNQKKDATLGMPHGTANNRLRKNILFHLLAKLNENVCFKCGLRIEKVEELSIEHKLPWEGRSAELFWNLDNIAFSHLHCNRPHIHGGGIAAKVGPDGTAWCSGHQSFIALDEFYLEDRRHNGVRTYCRLCYSEIRKKHKGRKVSASGGTGETPRT